MKATPDPPTGISVVQELIAEECDMLKSLLIEKQRAYGNSATDPIRLFSKASPDEQIRVRIDDKLSRLARGTAAGEDVNRQMSQRRDARIKAAEQAVLAAAREYARRWIMGSSTRESSDDLHSAARRLRLIDDGDL